MSWCAKTLLAPRVQEQSVKELQEEHQTNPEPVYKEAIDVRLLRDVHCCESPFSERGVRDWETKVPWCTFRVSNQLKFAYACKKVYSAGLCTSFRYPCSVRSFRRGLLQQHPLCAQPQHLAPAMLCLQSSEHYHISSLLDNLLLCSPL